MIIAKTEKTLAEVISIPFVEVHRNKKGLPTYATVIIPGYGKVTVRKLIADGKTSPKLSKSGKGIRLFGLSMSPHGIGGFGNVCASASEGCIGCCLDHQGQGGMSSVQAARLARKALWFMARGWTIEKLGLELDKIESDAEKGGYVAGVRLNVFSDIFWERFLDLGKWAAIRFYDYSKHVKRFSPEYRRKHIPANYHLTFSRSEANTSKLSLVLGWGGNVAVVFYEDIEGACGKGAKKQRIPSKYCGVPVIDGDVREDRFEDKSGSVVALRLKAKTRSERAKAMASGFCVPFGG